MRQDSARGHVPASLYRKTALFAASAPLWRALARLESGVLGDLIAETAIDRPIFIAGVPRSGTTIITEILARHPEVTSHRYSDFPNVYMPYWRNWLADRIGRTTSAPVERAHRDRVKVTLESPEAVEEVIWMQFFGHLHDPERSQLLDATTEQPAFERFYRDHLAKLMVVRGAKRYLAKGNYNATRLAYLLKLFPDARIVVPWRDPLAQVASLVKQDRLFSKLSEEDSRVTIQLQRSGHFEFGPGKRAINLGSRAQTDAIERDWAAGALATGWARYWAAVYAHVLDIIEDDKHLRDAVLLVDYGQLCERPAETLADVRDHCRLDEAGFEPIIAEYSSRLTLPDYYAPDFTREELDSIAEFTNATLARLRSATAPGPARRL